ANLQGSLSYDNTNMSAMGNLSSFAQHNQRLRNTVLTSAKNSQIQANRHLSFSNASIDSKEHVAIYTKANQTTKNSSLNAKGILSNITDGNHTIIGNVSHTGGAVLLQSDALVVEGENRLTARTTGNALLADLDGDLSLQTNQTLNISPQNHVIQAAGDLSLRVVAGDLHLWGQGGNLGNGSQQALHLESTLGGIELQGRNIHLKGSRLDANQDIGLYATQGHIFIDGIKNTLSDKKTIDALQHAKKQLNDVRTRLNALESLPRYITYHEQKDRLDRLSIKHQEYLDYQRSLKSLESPLPMFEMSHGGRVLPSSNSYFTDWTPPRIIRRTDPIININQDRSFPAEVMNFNVNQVFKLNQTYKDLIDQQQTLIKQQERLESRVNFLTQAVFGYEHSTASLNSKTGDITLAASLGILLSGANLDAAGDIHLSSGGMMPNAYTKATNSDTSQALDGSIVLDGLQNHYEVGNEHGDHHRIIAFSTPTQLTAGKNIRLHATHQDPNTHLVIQGGQLQAAQDIAINTNHSILLDHDLDYEYGYDRSTRKHGKWYRRKYTTTVSSNEWQDAVPTILTANNIRLKTHGLDRQNHIDLYGTQMHATTGNISLWSSGNIALYAVDNLHNNQYNSHTKRKLLGIRYNDTHAQGSTYLKTALPATLTANYIASHSQGDTTLEGTRFNYLSAASITASGRLALLAATNELQERHQKDSNWVLWQRTLDQGQIKQSAILPSFTGM
ncbi:hypothetical protein M2R47_09295, partial [Moraxella sp. Tifton1]|uniref:hemagglutinin repeat-containing protein n=1 Tax=Moraxella oculi TaxID=2940516 RepID=UPI002011AFC5